MDEPLAKMEVQLNLSEPVSEKTRRRLHEELDHLLDCNMTESPRYEFEIYESCRVMRTR